MIKLKYLYVKEFVFLSVHEKRNQIKVNDKIFFHFGNDFRRKNDEMLFHYGAIIKIIN